MRHSVVILEDNAQRVAAMRECLADKFPSFDQRFFASSCEVIHWLQQHWVTTAAISLDHDLERQMPADSDPGDGREVADFLASRPPHCPVVIHSTNVAAAIGMEHALADGGWQVDRIVPYEDLQWIQEAWLPLIRRLIVDSARPVSMPATAP